MCGKKTCLLLVFFAMKHEIVYFIVFIEVAFRPMIAWYEFYDSSVFPNWRRETVYKLDQRHSYLISSFILEDHKSANHESNKLLALNKVFQTSRRTSRHCRRVGVRVSTRGDCFKTFNNWVKSTVAPNDGKFKYFSPDRMPAAKLKDTPHWDISSLDWCTVRTKIGYHRWL